ncbi:MAG TPA: hypothetical protein VMY18_13260, partial [Acidobacteriota bacterium]|nr:hypothetical protein [Acidobacteriota bacterium]
MTFHSYIDCTSFKFSDNRNCAHARQLDQKTDCKPSSPKLVVGIDSGEEWPVMNLELRVMVD